MNSGSVNAFTFTPLYGNPPGLYQSQVDTASTAKTTSSSTSQELFEQTTGSVYEIATLSLGTKDLSGEPRLEEVLETVGCVRATKEGSTQAIAHLLEHFNKDWLFELYEKTKNPHLQVILGQKIEIRSAFEQSLSELSKMASTQQRPTCFVSFAIEEVVAPWLEKIFVPDLALVGVDPVFCFKDLENGMDLNAFQERILETDKVVVVCTPKAEQYCKDRHPPFGFAQEVALAKKREKKDTVIPVWLKGNPKKFDPNVLFGIDSTFGSILNEDGRLVWSYYAKAFELFARIRGGIGRDEARKIKESFFKTVETILEKQDFDFDQLKLRSRYQSTNTQGIPESSARNVVNVIPTSLSQGVSHLDRARTLYDNGEYRQAASHLACCSTSAPDDSQNNLQKYELLCLLVQQNDDDILNILEVLIFEILDQVDKVNEHLVPRYQLAILLGDHFNKEGSVDYAMTCYGKATRIAKAGDHRLLLEQAQDKAFFLLRDQSGLIKKFHPLKTDNPPEILALGKNLKQIELYLEKLYQLKKFFLHDRNDALFKTYLLNIFDSLTVFFAVHNENGNKTYEQHRQAVTRYFSELCLHPSKAPTSIYSEKLVAYREHQNNLKPSGNLTEFQRQSLKRFKEFIQTILDDIFILIGAPSADSNYAFWFTSSINQEESFVYPNLEFFFQLEHKDKDYYENMLQLFKLALLSLGEPPLQIKISLSMEETGERTQFCLDYTAFPRFVTKDIKASTPVKALTPVPSKHRLLARSFLKSTNRILENISSGSAVQSVVRVATMVVMPEALVEPSLIWHPAPLKMHIIPSLLIDFSDPNFYLEFAPIQNRDGIFDQIVETWRTGQTPILHGDPGCELTRLLIELARRIHGKKIPAYIEGNYKLFRGSASTFLSAGGTFGEDKHLHATLNKIVEKRDSHILALDEIQLFSAQQKSMLCSFLGGGPKSIRYAVFVTTTAGIEEFFGKDDGSLAQKFRKIMVPQISPKNTENIFS